MLSSLQHCGYISHSFPPNLESRMWFHNLVQMGELSREVQRRGGGQEFKCTQLHLGSMPHGSRVSSVAMTLIHCGLALGSMQQGPWGDGPDEDNALLFQVISGLFQWAIPMNWLHVWPWGCFLSPHKLNSVLMLQPSVCWQSCRVAPSTCFTSLPLS